MTNGDRSLAVFIDFENLALGFQGRRDRFDIERVLERLVEKGKIVVKRAYADWNRFAAFTAELHEAAIELTEIPRRGQSGKNSADIRLCVDAMDLAYSKEHIDTFVVVSGDSDFSPLVSKLKELGKHVIGLGMQDSTSELLRDNCDEFIYYEDLGRTTELPAGVDPRLPENKRKVFALLLESLLALRRENKEVLWSSMVKDTMKRKKPSFNEAYHGYRTFSELLEDAQKEGLVELDTDQRSQTYVVTRFGAEMSPQTPAAGGAAPPIGATKKKSRRRRGSGKKRAGVGENGNGSPALSAAGTAPSPAPAARGPAPAAPTPAPAPRAPAAVAPPSPPPPAPPEPAVLPPAPPSVPPARELVEQAAEPSTRPAERSEPKPAARPTERPEPKPAAEPATAKPRGRRTRAAAKPKTAPPASGETAPREAATREPATRGRSRSRAAAATPKPSPPPPPEPAPSPPPRREEAAADDTLFPPDYAPPWGKSRPS